MRVAAAALIAAALSESSEAASAAARVSSSWTPGNSSLPGNYYGSAPLDINGDGIADFNLQSAGYGSLLTLEPLTVDGVNNQILGMAFPSRPSTSSFVGGMTAVRHQTAVVMESSKKAAALLLTRRFENADDILSAIGPPIITVPDQGDLSNFVSSPGYIGVIFHVPPATGPGTRTGSSGSDEVAYLLVSTSYGGATTIYDSGYQPLAAVPVRPSSWGRLKNLYR